MYAIRNFPSYYIQIYIHVHMFLCMFSHTKLSQEIKNKTMGNIEVPTGLNDSIYEEEKKPR